MTSQVTPGPGDRMAIVGRTGSGKTTFARALFGAYRNLVVIDPKHRFELPRCVLVHDAATFRQTYPQRATRVILRPDPAERDHATVDEAIGRVLRFGRTCVLVDEAMLLSSPGWIVPNYRRAIVTGRELLVPVVSLTQRPIGVHNVVFSEADRIVVFDLALGGDRAKVAEFTGDEARERVGRPHAFLYYGPETDGRVVSCPPLQLPQRELGGATDGGNAGDGAADDRQPGHGHGPGNRRDLRGQGAGAGVPRPGPLGRGGGGLAPSSSSRLPSPAGPGAPD